MPSNTPKYVCAKCRNKIPVEDLESIFQKQLKHLFFSPSEIAEYLKVGHDAMEQKAELVGVLEGEQRKIKREMDKLYDLYMNEKITKDGFGEKYHPLSDRQKQVGAELPELQAELDVLKIHYLSSDQIIADAKDLYSRWSELSSEDKRSIVEAITESIVIGDGEISINLCYMPAGRDALISETDPNDENGGSGGESEGVPHGSKGETRNPQKSNKKSSYPYKKESGGKRATQPQPFASEHRIITM